MRGVGRLGSELERCGTVYGAFWKKFVELLDPNQRAQLAKESYLILFLSNVKSDPSTEFGFDVLSHMNSR